LVVLLASYEDLTTDERLEVGLGVLDAGVFESDEDFTYEELDAEDGLSIEEELGVGFGVLEAADDLTDE
jgi:hypothetical protein